MSFSDRFFQKAVHCLRRPPRRPLEREAIALGVLRNMPQRERENITTKKAEAIASALVRALGRGHDTNSVSSSSIFWVTLVLSKAMNSRIRRLLLMEVLKPSRL